MSRDRWEGTGISPGEVEGAVADALAEHHTNAIASAVTIARAQIAGCIVATLMLQNPTESFDVLLGKALVMADEVCKQAGAE